MLYLVSYSWYEDYSPVIVEGDEVEDWQAFCNSLIEIAGNRLVDKKSSGWIGWDGIVDELVALLGERGYKVLKPPQANYWGSIIIGDKTDQSEGYYKLLGSSQERIVEHNRLIRQELYGKG